MSYALSVAFSLIAFGLTWLIAPHKDIFFYFMIVVGAAILLAPYLYALSKIIWANMFFTYKGPGDIR